MKRYKILVRNLLLTLICLFAAHSIYFVATVLIYKMKRIIILYYFIFAVIYHILIFIVLVYLKEYFVFEKNGKFLTRVNLSNIITCIRITSLPVIMLLMLNVTRYPILPFFLPYLILVFLTDLLDGYTARFLKETTKIGKYLDSISDYVVLIVLSIIFTNYSLIPRWFLLLVLIRLISLALGVVIMSLLENEILYTLTFLGKASIFTIMALYVLELLSKVILVNPGLLRLTAVAEYGVGAIVVVSFIEKMNIIIRKLMSWDKNNKNNKE